MGISAGGGDRDRTLEESCKGLGSVSLKINNQHTHQRMSPGPGVLLQLSGAYCR